MKTLAPRTKRTGSLEALRGSFLTDPGCAGFRSLLGCLREFCPAGKPVVVRSAWLAQDIAGECTRTAQRFVIRLNRDLDEQMAIEALVHEWAHALAWNFRLDQLARTGEVSPEEFQLAAHDSAWGCEFARVWRVYISRISLD